MTDAVAPGEDALLDAWRAAWPRALAAWSRYTRLHDPRLCATTVEAAQEGLQGSFAMIRLLDQGVVIDLEAVQRHGLQDYAVEILAHEIGHHVLAPASATDHYRLLARMRRALPTFESATAMVANLYTDLLINDRLQRQDGLRMADVYRALARGTASSDPLWTFYMRSYEHLWKRERGELAGAGVTEAIDTDAWLCARLVRAYAGDWLRGGARFAALVLPYLVEQGAGLASLRALHDTAGAAAGCQPGAVHEIEEDERDADCHPSRDPLVMGAAAGPDAPDEPGESDGADRPRQGAGQAREPFEYGEILKAAGVALDDHEIAMRYYRERALPHLVPFPARRPAPSTEPRIAAPEPWDIGDPLEEIDWLHSLGISPRPVPGLTMVRRALEDDPGEACRPEPVDLDVYVDSSGSMPDPQRQVSYPALAGAIVALSALRAGASVQATLWSGKEQVLGTDGFVRDADAVLRVLTGFFGGATCFPIHRLRATYEARTGRGRRRGAHLLMISDDGITTMFDRDERGASGWDVAARALATAGAGGTMALDVPPEWDALARSSRIAPYRDLLRARDEQGWEIHAVADMAQLVAFARAFSRRHYGAQPAQAGARP
ncbi:VWA domain-containing protein [uncultured Massilia sp.]|uniref:VWA domain-containing protein n=1 Tax=uncultured Massilia sp. TaxID=169973 RepID=UPI0025DD6A3C|nr:VWA domain-containing protein [uncultured Massilia sp.]